MNTKTAEASGQSGTAGKSGSVPNKDNKILPLQDPFLNTLRLQKTPVSIYLVNGIKLQGIVDSFDQYVILLANTVTQMVYKHAISTIVPGKQVKL